MEILRSYSCPKLPKFLSHSARLFLTALVVSFGCGFQSYNNYVTNNLQKVGKTWLNTSYAKFHDWHPNQRALDLAWATLNCSKEIGYMGGAILLFLLANELGRLLGLMGSSLVAVIGSLMCYYSLYLNYIIMIAGRFMQGLSMMFSVGIGTLFLVEIAPTEFRGTVGGMIQVFRAVGGTLALVLSLPETFGTAQLWTTVMAVPGIPAAVQFVFMFFCYGSPRHLYIVKSRFEEAAEAIEYYQGADRVASALKDVRKEKYMIDKDSQVPCVALLHMRRFWRPFLLGSLALSNGALTGMPLIQLYSTDMFIKVGIERHVAAHSTLVLGACHIVSAVAVALSVERLGRKPMLIFGNLGCCTTLAMVSTFLTLGSERNGILLWDYLTVISAALFMYMFPVVASVGNIVATELCHQRIRSYAFGVGLFTGSILVIFCTYMYPMAEHLVGRSWSFVPFCFFTAISSLIYWIWLPETGGKTFESLAFNHDNIVDSQEGEFKLSEEKR